MSNVRPIRTSGATEEEQEGTSKVFDAMAEETRLQWKMALGVVGFAAVLTLYFFFLNAWVLYKATPRPFVLRFDHAPNVHDARYRASVRWEPLGAAGSVHPRLILGSSVLPERAEHSRVMVGLDDRVDVAIDVPDNTTGGEHRGQIVFDRISGADGPERIVSDVRLGVEASLFRNWFVVARWLMFLAVAYALFYVFCLLYFPLASGTVNVWVPASGRTTPRRVRMKPPLLRFLMPWMRGQQSLQKLLRNARVPSAAGCTARIIFFLRGVPMMLPDRHTRKKLLKSTAYGPADTAPDVPPPEDRRRIGGIEIMSESVAYSVGSEADAAFTAFRYKK
ncbi:MAG: hypothetical protein JWO56_3086 [Acidobacteria bacterium]|nr:hypothetical protein [Acidobacteriota bacterium]